MGLLTVGDFLGCILPANFTQTPQELVREVIGDLSMVDHDSSAAVTMETSKPESVSAPLHSSSVAAPTWRNMDMQTPLTHNKMDIQTPLTALYIHTVPAAHTQPQPYPLLPAGPQGPATFHLSMLPLNPKETLPLLTLHIAGGPQGLNSAAQPLPAVRPRSAGKHVCPHCGRDCMKPSVLEKHLRCHTGERPYPCATCGVSFKTQSNLYKHKRTQAHARLWSESEHSSLGSQDSVCSSTCGSGLSLDGCSDESGSVERDVSVTCCDSTMQLSPGKRRGTETGWALKTDPVNDNKESSSVSLNVMPNECQSTTTAKEEQTRTEHPKAPPTTNRHLPLQRQEATLFSKQWESSVSRGKSQSHDSTDSGFSESSDQYPSPIGVLHDHSMESLTESTLEDLEQPGCLKTSAKSGQEAGSGMSERGHRTLEERISKLISENSAVVEDKRLENARPRKTVLSKQGSIDLPLPYTYKDSFHFDMRNSKDRKVMLDSNRKPGSYGSVPTQRSTSVEHAPLTRSSSLPYNVTLLQPEMSSPTSSACRRDYDTIARRGSFGPIDAAGFAIKSVDQHVSTHHPLVRQAAVDCHHATEEEPSASNCDRDSSDACKEPSNRKWRRKKAAKFAYNKWYMYGAGTFKKLYNTEKGSDNVALKAKRLPVNPEHEVVHGVQRRSLTVHKEPAAIKDSTLNSPNGSATVCHPSSLPVNLNHKAKQPPSLCTSLKSALLRNPSTLQFPSFHSTDSIIPTESERSVNKESLPDSVSQQWVTHIPSDRKKQRTDVKTTSRLGTETEPNTSTHAFHSVTGTVPEQHTDPSPINSQTIPYLKGIVSAPCIASRKHLNTSSAISIHPTSFLPKYQLKLPNPAGANTNALPHTLNVLTVNNVSASDLSSSYMDQTSLSIMTLASQEKKHMDPRVPLLLHSHSIERINSSESIQDNASVFPTASLAVTSAARLNHSTACTFTVVHRRCTTITTTTASVQNRHTKLGTTSVQSSPSGAAAGSAPKQFARPPAMATQSAFAPSTTTTGQNPPSAVTVTASSGGQHPPVSHTSHSSTLSGQRTPTETETPVVACQLVRFDSAQPSAKNVFHVHTPDLQICLQIISDEQLALIEPQIERQGRVAETTGLSHKNCEGMDPQVMCSYLQSSVTIENASDGKYQERTGGHQEMNQTEPSSSKTTESINPLPPTPFQKTQAKALVTEADDVGQAVTVVEPVPSSESLRPQKQTMAKEHVRLDGSVSQDGLMCLNRSGQEELIENTTVSHLRHHGSQQKPPNATTTCHVITLKCQPTGCEAGLESGETRPAPQAGTDQHSSAAVCGGQVLHGNISPLRNNNCKIPKKVTPPAAACGADIVDGRMVSSEMLRRSAHADRGSSRAEPLDSSQDITPGESPGRVESDHTEKQLSIQVERAAHVSSESPTEGLMGEEEEEEGDSLAERARPRGGGGTPGPPDSAGRGLKLRQGAGERKHRRVQGQQSRGALGERGVTTKESLLQQGKLESDGGCTHISPLTAREKRAANEEIMESCTHSWLPEEPPQHLSQIQFGASASRPQMLLQGFLSTSNDRDSPARLLGPPQSELEPSQFSRHCESAVACDQQTQTLQTNPQRCLLARTQNDFRQIDVGHQTQPPIHNVYLQNQQTASLALSGPSLSQISTADNHNTLTSYSKSICPTEAHRTQSLWPGIKPSTSACSHSVKVIDHSGRSGDDGLATCATGPLETSVHPLTPWTSPTYPQPGGDHRDGGGQQTHGLITSHTGSPVTTLQGHTSHIGSPVTTLQGHTSHIVSPITTLQGHTSHIVSPVTTLQGHTSHIVSPVTTLQGHTSHIVSPVTTLQGHTSHIVSPVTTLQGHTSHIVSPVTTLQGHTSHIVSLVTTTLSSNKSHCVSWPGQLHSYQLPECQLSGAVRPVLSSQDYPDESSSSSDDEGKLIIEL